MYVRTSLFPKALRTYPGLFHNLNIFEHARNNILDITSLYHGMALIIAPLYAVADVVGDIGPGLNLWEG